MPHLVRILLSAVLFLSVPVAAFATGAETVSDIRKVAFSGDGSASATLLKRTKTYLQAAAKATRRPVPLERAVMDIRLTGVVYGTTGRNSAKVAVALSGSRAASRTMTVNSFMPEGRGRDAALAEAIARRVALDYRLAPPPAGKLQAKRPGKNRKHMARQRRTAPRSVTPAPVARDKRPVVIPTEAALTVRSRALPAGAQEKVAPCVVTRTILCN